MTTHSSDWHLLLDIPDLHLTIISSDRKMSAFLRPGNRSDSVPLAEVDELADRTSISVPNVNVLSECDGQRVL